MATDQLPITGNSQSQSATQSPQSGVQSINTGSKASSVQPGTATDLLNGPGSLSLHTTTLPSVDLTTTQPLPSSTATAAPAKPQHHVNPALFGFVALLFLVAGILVWSISRSAKTTK